MQPYQQKVLGSYPLSVTVSRDCKNCSLTDFAVSVNKIGPKPSLKPPCNTLCVHQCTKIITENQRQQILKYFCGLGDLNLQRLFIQKCVEQEKQGSDNAILQRHYFTINGRRIRVCKLFFLSTLSIKPSFVAEALDVIFDDKPADDDKFIHPRILEGVMNHIKSIPRIISCNIDAKGEREYVETSIKVDTMYQLYIKYCKDNKYPQTTFEMYQEIFNSKNEIFKKCQESVPLLEANEVTLITLKADSKPTK